MARRRRAVAVGQAALVAALWLATALWVSCMTGTACVPFNFRSVLQMGRRRLFLPVLLLPVLPLLRMPIPASVHAAAASDILLPLLCCVTIVPQA